MTQGNKFFTICCLSVVRLIIMLSRFRHCHLVCIYHTQGGQMSSFFILFPSSSDSAIQTRAAKQSCAARLRGKRWQITEVQFPIIHVHYKQSTRQRLRAYPAPTGLGHEIKLAYFFISSAEQYTWRWGEREARACDNKLHFPPLKIECLHESPLDVVLSTHRRPCQTEIQTNCYQSITGCLD